MTAHLLVGRIARAHGNKGEVIVNLETDFPHERFRAGHTLLVGPEEGGEPRRIAAVRFHQGRPVVAFDGVGSMNAAEALAGAELRMDAGDMAALPANTFYRHDLVGCEVVDTAGKRIGRVTAVEGTMERSRLSVAGDAGEILIPLVAPICVNVDVAARRVVVDPPDGLLELNSGPQ